MNRPYPPIQDNDCEENIGYANTQGLLHFEPANEDLWPWIVETFLDPASKLYNKDHDHIICFRPPKISFLWAYTKCEMKGREVMGTTEQVMINVGGWKRDRQELQLINWFGDVPKFIITLDARKCQVMDDTDFCALVEHELYHVGHKINKDTNTFEYNSMGEPKLYLRGHDVEEFHGVVRRYGASEDVKEMARYANSKPEIGRASIAQACGTCLLRVV